MGAWVEEEGESGFLSGGGEGRVQRSDQRGATPLAVLCAGGMRGSLLLLSAPQKWQLGFSVWGGGLVFLFYLLAYNLPQLLMLAVILSPL